MVPHFTRRPENRLSAGHPGGRIPAAVQRLFKQEIGYKGECWISKQFKDVWCASPLYDWSTSDIWHANYRFGYDYNRLYDLYYMAGLKPSQMRVASPFNDYSKDSLNLYRVIDPEVWTKLVGRVQGANFAAIYGHTKAMGLPETITLPEGAHMEILHPVPAGHTARPPAQQLRQKISEHPSSSGTKRAAGWTKPCNP